MIMDVDEKSFQEIQWLISLQHNVKSIRNIIIIGYNE